MSKTRDVAIFSGQTAPDLSRELSFAFQRVLDRLDKLEGIRGEAILGAEGSGNTRVVAASEFIEAPAGELAEGQWELTVYNDGANPVFRIRYNDAGTVKTGDVAML